MELQDPEAGEAPLAEVMGIQFGILSAKDIVTLSVFEREHSIITAKDLWDSRLGIYNLPGNNNHCQTCGARKASDCDGHFGHITLPMPIYHPLHIYFLKKLLNQICLVCKRFKEKEFKKGTFEEQATWMEMKRQLNISEFLDIASNWETDATKKAYVLKTKCKIEALNSQAFALKRNWAHIS